VFYSTRVKCLDFPSPLNYFISGYQGEINLRLLKIIFVLIFLILTVNNLHAQEKDSTENFIQNSSAWLRLGLGKSYFGPTTNVSLSYAYKNNIFTARFLKADEFRFGVDGSVFPNPSIGFKEFGLLYGLSQRNDIVLVSASAGIAYVNGIDRGREISPYHLYEQVNISTLGFAYEAELRVEFANFIGMGFTFFGNLNSKRNYYGGMLMITAGKLR
jgi:hypothetical protein